MAELYSLPDGWEWKTLSDIFNIEREDKFNHEREDTAEK